MPGGANGVAVKSKLPNRKVWADNFGLTRDARSRLIVMFACSSKRSHSDNGKSGSAVARPALKWFLYVWIALSAKFRLCVCVAELIDNLPPFVLMHSASLLKFRCP